MKSTNNMVIPRRPLLLLAAAMLFLVPTMLGHLATWVPLGFLVAILAKFWLEKRDLRLRSIAGKIGLALAAFAAVFTTYGTRKPSSATSRARPAGRRQAHPARSQAR